MLLSQGGGLEALSQTPIPKQSWESPRVLLQPSSPSHSLARAQGEHRSPLFQQENRGTESATVLLCYPAGCSKQAGTGLCAKILLFFIFRR